MPAGHDGPVDQRRPLPEPAAFGIDAGYQDVFGTWREPSPESLGLIHESMGLEAGEVPPPSRTIVIDRRSLVGPSNGDGDPDAGGDLTERLAAEGVLAPGNVIRLEDGTEVGVDLDLAGHTSSGRAASDPADRWRGALAELPVGHHSLVSPEGEVRPLLVSPGKCHLPVDLRIWGVTAQLYAARSSRSWGIGDIGDLARLVDWAAERGGAMVGLNPLHAPTPSPSPPNSPYSPSSRRWRDPSTISVEQVPGFSDLPDADERAASGRQLNDLSTIDRAAVWAAKRSALEALWERFRSVVDPDFERYLAEHGDSLARWGAFCTVADDAARAGGTVDWRRWVDGLRRPDGSGIAGVLRNRGDDLRFWCWLQWLAERQLVDARSDEVVLTDLAVGFAPDGFDAWEWQDLTAPGVRIGAPPDLLGPDGQDWGLPPLVPWKLAAAGYRPFAQTVAAAMRHSLGVRIDHVMGLFRLFWLPPGLSGADGAYVRFNGHDLLHVLAIESARAGAMVVGEDLGTVEAGVRETLAAAGVLSTRLLWFEDDPTSHWPSQAQAAVTTHDLPTITGVWTGADLADLRVAGVPLPADGDEQFRHRLRVAGSCDDGADLDHVLVEAHRAVASSPCMVATAALDDLVGAPRRPNVPGTIDQHPNWRIPLPVTLDDLPGHPVAESIATVMAETRSRRTDPVA